MYLTEDNAVAIAAFVGILPAAIALVVSIWEGCVLPRLIPEARIREGADEFVAKYGFEASWWAFVEEDAAWRRSQPREQGYWRRIRQRLEKQGF